MELEENQLRLTIHSGVAHLLYKTWLLDICRYTTSATFCKLRQTGTCIESCNDRRYCSKVYTYICTAETATIAGGAKAKV